MRFPCPAVRDALMANVGGTLIPQTDTQTTGKAVILPS